MVTKLMKRSQTYRYQFKGKVQNPDVDGDCVLNWLVAGHTHAQEPWISNHPRSHHFIQGKSANYIGVVSCTADKTPECTCMSGFADINDDTTRSVSSGLCASSSNQLFNINDPAGTNTIQLQGDALKECRAISDSASFVQTQFSQTDYAAKTDDASAHTVNNFGLEVSCRLDIEPFAPDAREKDWYAHEITNWGALTCHKKGVDLTKPHCRCYILKEKSFYQANQRSHVYQYHRCLQCDGSSCKGVSNIAE